MTSKEYLKKAGYNENYPIGERQLCRLLEGYAKIQHKEIMQLWHDFAEAGELHINRAFIDKYDELTNETH